MGGVVEAGAVVLALLGALVVLVHQDLRMQVVVQAVRNTKKGSTTRTKCRPLGR